MRLGAHMSIRGDLSSVPPRAAALTLTAAQVFSRNPRGGRRRELSIKEIEVFRNECQDHDIHPVVLHAPYTLNLASKQAQVRNFGRRMLVEDLMRCRQLGILHLILHPGSHGGQGVAVGSQWIIEGIEDAFERAREAVDGGVKLTLELMSGQGSELGSTFEEMARLIEGVSDSSALCVCLDTCHSWARGYDLASADGLEAVVEELDATFGLERLAVIHLNDSKSPLGSRKDQHARLGEGYLGHEALARVVTHQKLREIPFIMETPVGEEAEYATEAARLRSWMIGCR